MDKGQELKETNNTVNKGDNSNIGNFIGHNSPLTLAFKKTEQIASAVHLVAGLMSDKEPLKQELKKSSIVLIKTISSLSLDTIADLKIKFFKDELILLSSFITVAKFNKLISPMNYSILSEQINVLLTFVGDIQNKNTSLSHFDFTALPTNTNIRGLEDEQEIFNKQFSDYKKQDSFKKDIKDNYKNIKDNNDIYVPKVSPKDYENPYKATPIKKTKDKFPVKTGVDLKKENRRNIILNVIQKKGKVNIKDISLAIKDCSEKTVQRELLNLVDEGLIKKEGERRWSIYSLA